MSDIKEVNRRTAEVKERVKRLDERDFRKLAESLIADYQRRKSKRDDRERQWKEIDRQVAMEPDIAFKRLPNGKIDSKKAWCAETELPLQAQALEVLTADARRMLVADDGSWFSAHAGAKDQDFQYIEENIRVFGDKNEILSQISQDNVDKIVHGFLYHNFRQYDFASRLDVINAEAFKYGIGVGRGRLETKSVWIHEARGVRTATHRLPVILPCSIKNVYPEETRPSVHSSTVLGPTTILHDNIKYENIALAANSGSKEAEDEDGGWMPKTLSKIEPDKQGYVELLEVEGDVIFTRKTTESIVVPGCIVTVAMGAKEAGNHATYGVIRFRFRKRPQSSYLLFPYMQESADDVYATSPLMKGRTIQGAATYTMNRYLDAAALKNQPPTGFGRDDQTFAKSGGPEIYPGAMWETTDPVKVYEEVGGDPSALAAAFMNLVNLYAELTGVLPARVGAQTKSHTTATAKDVELQRGSARTVDYVNAIGHGPLTSWLFMAYDLARDGMTGKMPLYIESYGGWVEIDKKMLPDSNFVWFGSGGPQEKQQRAQQRMGAILNVLKIDQMRISMQQPPRYNWDALQDELMREGGFNDISSLVNSGGPTGGSAHAPGVPGADTSNPGAVVAALQNLQGSQQGAS